MFAVSLDSLCRKQVQVSVYCARRIPAHLRCTQCSILFHLVNICFLPCICRWQILQIQTCLHVVIGPGFVSTLPAFMKSRASHPASPHGRLANKTVNQDPTLTPSDLWGRPAYAIQDPSRGKRPRFKGEQPQPCQMSLNEYGYCEQGSHRSEKSQEEKLFLKVREKSVNFLTCSEFGIFRH